VKKATLKALGSVSLAKRCCSSTARLALKAMSAATVEHSRQPWAAVAIDSLSRVNSQSLPTAVLTATRTHTQCGRAAGAGSRWQRAD
jgi:hypothetical protein